MLHKLELMDALYVKETKNLNCGIEYDYFHKVFDDKDKLQQLLSPEGYQIYLAEMSCRE